MDEGSIAFVHFLICGYSHPLERLAALITIFGVFIMVAPAATDTRAPGGLSASHEMLCKGRGLPGYEYNAA